MPKITEIPSISIASGLVSRGKKAEQAYDSPGHFHEYVFNQALAPFHWEMYEVLLEGHKHPEGKYNPFLCLAPRDHAKTTVGEAFALWTVGLNQQELVQFICSVSTLARQRLKKIESCIRNNRRYKDLFGQLYPDNIEYTWNNDAMEVLRDREAVWEAGREERDPTFAAFGIDTSVEGGRATKQFFDDIVTRSNSSSEVQRDTVKQAYWMSFDPMLVPTGQQVIFGTRYHYLDFYSELIPGLDNEGLYTDLYMNSDEEDSQGQEEG